jgi:hypothetical protein
VHNGPSLLVASPWLRFEAGQFAQLSTPEMTGKRIKNSQRLEKSGTSHVFGTATEPSKAGFVRHLMQVQEVRQNSAFPISPR